MKTALIQFNATADKQDNIRRSKEFVLKAIRAKAQWVLLPEVFSFRGDSRDKGVLRQQAENIPGTTTKIFSEIACQKKVNILLGSILEKAPAGKAYNTSVAIASSGKIQKYRKIHLFDARLGGKIIRESDSMAPGKQLKTVNVAEFKAGLSVCYDLRFADLYNTYAKTGANVLTVPSCFTKQTGQAHWEALLRARAIENLSYVLAPAQVGCDARGVEAFGNSMIVSPWGEIIARGSNHKEEIIYGELSLDEVKNARAKLPGVIKK